MKAEEIKQKQAALELAIKSRQYTPKKDIKSFLYEQKTFACIEAKKYFSSDEVQLIDAILQE
jgi:UTP-glucose-1-phosphate uridylyltransferase